MPVIATALPFFLLSFGQPAAFGSPLVPSLDLVHLLSLLFEPRTDVLSLVPFGVVKTIFVTGSAGCPAAGATQLKRSVKILLTPVDAPALGFENVKSK